MFKDKRPYGRGFHPAKILFFLLVFIGFALLLGAIVMLLWNAILPDLVGVKPLGIWQAIGLLLLSRILFGGFRFGGPFGAKRSAKRKYWKEKWMNMNDAEKEEMRKKWKERCGPKKRRSDQKEDDII